MNISIRKADEKDFPAIISLVRELAVFLGQEDKVSNSVEQMKKEKDFFQCIVAENTDKEIIGEAIYFLSYGSWIGKKLYLDDLFVKEVYRKKRIGTKLMKKIFEIALKENCHSVHCQVRNYNKSAIEFYKKCEANLVEDGIDCIFYKKNINSFLNSLQKP